MSQCIYIIYNTSIPLIYKVSISHHSLYYDFNTQHRANATAIGSSARVHTT